MKALLICILVFKAIVSADEIADIREHYNSVKDCIERGTLLYTTGISINTEDMSYPALGHYQVDITFYWNCEAGVSWLVLATWTGEYAAHNEYGEVLYSESGDMLDGGNEEVSFMFVSFDNSDDIRNEYRWWFSGGEIIQSSAKTMYPGETVEYTPPDPFDQYDYDPDDFLEIFHLIH